MKLKLIFLNLVLSCATLLSGCASLNSKFDCPMKPGVMCESLDQVNIQVDQGKLGQSSNITTCKNCNTIENSAINLNNSFITPYSNTALNPSDPIRLGETIMRIWLAPYEDKDNNYYQATVLYTVIKPGFWVGSPVKAISAEGDNV